ncbi:gluconolaconase [Aequorivita sp. SDUM287046]|uniref:Gluconolaconase n=1 Tax=Aequorivita aurantiaca TaxID=3053356 RepID=A0ABT8DNF1_9FLAO|nr:gluconolaconase [Aequorivita aurantiaca]MDN3725496.1 gluconolaconase [Aequorivita aurantiaca]
MKNIFLLFLLTGCATVIPSEPTARIEFMAPEAYPEGIAFDPAANVYYVSSARTGTIGKVTPDGLYTALYTDPELRSSYGLKMHPDGKMVYACVADANYSKYSTPDTKKKMSRLVGISTADGKKVQDIDLAGLVPGEHFANDLTFDTSGNAYITDSFAHVIYKVTPSGHASVFADSPLFKTKGVGLNGIVWHPDGYLLAVNSGTGILYKIDAKQPTDVRKVNTDQYFLNGDGLYLMDDKSLILVQNGGSNKIYKLTSDSNWQSAKIASTTLAADRFAYPTTATVAREKNVWVMNAKFNELADSSSVPSKKFSMQHARFIPVGK